MGDGGAVRRTSRGQLLAAPCEARTCSGSGEGGGCGDERACLRGSGALCCGHEVRSAPPPPPLAACSATPADAAVAPRSAAHAALDGSLPERIAAAHSHRCARSAWNAAAAGLSEAAAPAGDAGAMAASVGEVEAEVAAKEAQKGCGADCGELYC